MKSANVWTSMLQLVRAMIPFELGAFGSIRQMYKCCLFSRVREDIEVVARHSRC